MPLRGEARAALFASMVALHGGAAEAERASTEADGVQADMVDSDELTAGEQRDLHRAVEECQRCFTNRECAMEPHALTGGELPLN